MTQLELRQPLLCTLVSTLQSCGGERDALELGCCAVDV